MEVEYEPKGPKPIRKLSKDVINQIAAAEVSPFSPSHFTLALAFVFNKSATKSFSDPYRSSIDPRMLSKN